MKEFLNIQLIESGKMKIKMLEIKIEKLFVKIQSTEPENKNQIQKDLSDLLIIKKKLEEEFNSVTNKDY